MEVTGRSLWTRARAAIPPARSRSQQATYHEPPGARTFPAGKGAAQACGRVTRSGVTATFCTRYSKKHVVIALYFGTTVSSLSDAAAKTSQALSASGG